MNSILFLGKQSLAVLATVVFHTLRSKYAVKHRHEEQDTQEVDKGDATHDKCKKKEPPVFSARCTTLEVYVLAKASLDGINEIHRFGTHLKVFICHDTDKFDWLGLFTLQIYEKYVNNAP